MRANPVLVEVVRGDMVESRHRGAGVVATVDGDVYRSWGDVDAPIYPRSAIKPIQALAFVESGAVEHFGLGDVEIALAAASHRGKPMHVDPVAAWLARIGLGGQHLECGAQVPFNPTSAEALRRAGQPHTALHHNSSGKHAAFLTTALHLGESLNGYIRPDHPVQRRLASLIEDMTGVSLAAAPRGQDGCGIPVYGIPLVALARGMAKLVSPSALPPRRAAAARRICAAMTAHPELLVGLGRMSTIVITLTKGAVLVKSGAEGVFVAGVPDRGLGIAVKIDDGGGRAADVALLATLREVGALTDEQLTVLRARLHVPLRNSAGTVVGTMRSCLPQPNETRGYAGLATAARW